MSGNPDPHEGKPCRSPEWCGPCEEATRWQARLDALEEAAELVEGFESIPDPRGVADAIRELKKRKP